MEMWRDMEMRMGRCRWERKIEMGEEDVDEDEYGDGKFWLSAAAAVSWLPAAAVSWLPAAAVSWLPAAAVS
jgi:hypothetical protein